MTPPTEGPIAAAEATFTDAVTGLHSRLFAMAVTITANRAVAEDALASAYAAAWGKYRKGDVGELDRYLWRSVARQARRSSFLHRRPPASLSPPEPTDPADVVAGEAGLAALLAQLPVNQRAVVALRYVAGFSEAEVAELLSIPAGTVKSRLSRAAHTLRTKGASHRDPDPRNRDLGTTQGATNA